MSLKRLVQGESNAWLLVQCRMDSVVVEVVIVYLLLLLLHIVSLSFLCWANTYML